MEEHTPKFGGGATGTILHPAVLVADIAGNRAVLCVTAQIRYCAGSS